MTLADIMNGPIWILYIVTIIFAILSIIFLSGHGSGLIAGYNTKPRGEKDKYDKQKLCKCTGVSMSFITVLILITSLFYRRLPADFAYFLSFLIILAALLIIISYKSICKKR